MTDLEAWLGKQQERTEILDARQARLLAATLDKPAPSEGSTLPNCWHWAWFNDALPAAELGRDGHPKRGGFLPPVPLPRRMWAGGELEFVAPLIVGEQTTKRSTIENIKHRDGSSGKLCIVTIGHQLVQAGKLCVDEKQSLVFREDPAEGAPVPPPIEPPKDAKTSHTLTPDPVLMFRYSALTFNGHRIHYDVDYARDIEGYPDLVFHAPLTATTLCAMAGEQLGDGALKHFSYRATAPLFCNQAIEFNAKSSNGTATMWAVNPAGGQAMLATATG